jgi:hypothetical protein
MKIIKVTEQALFLQLLNQFWNYQAEFPATRPPAYTSLFAVLIKNRTP